MSSPINPISDLFGPTEDTAPQIEAGRLAPPAEVLDLIAQASVAYDELRAAGHRVAFVSAIDGEPLGIELRDVDGNRLQSLSIAETLDLAAGMPRA